VAILKILLLSLKYIQCRYQIHTIILATIFGNQSYLLLRRDC